ncbi:conserved hypothetical protein [Paecilomyces variotii No. 5]|uniref:Cytoplasmic tRNA 2-thiolation protein 2 n=1 Tax=Byssochlamys spectabilis (strain No. 5 / NBRC 109023) TaxID=1356009 RepID=V5G3A9_BYSSN|nr:conserved hypothetical protein [Paecilomyces variotii No. 5]
MPGKHFNDPCSDCQDAEAIIDVRTRHLCRDCYIQFTNRKVVRRMDYYRQIRNAPKDKRRKLLLPLSYGPSSSVLLHMLNEQLERQTTEWHGTTAYDLHILIVDPSTISPSNPSCQERFDSVRQKYSRHTYTQIPFHSIFKYDQTVKDAMKEFAGPEFVDDPSKPDEDRLDAFRASIPSATSRTDIDNVLLNRLIIAFAKESGCEGILWGDSDSRLASKTLASVAKGRGSSLIWQVCDGMSPSGLQFTFPLRDLYKSELQQYASLIPELQDILIPDQSISTDVSARNMSIDELMMQYIQTQGEKYPGIMANVVRTVTKLQRPPLSGTQPRCALCGTVDIQGSSAQTYEGGGSLFCYGCARSKSDLIPVTR